MKIIEDSRKIRNKIINAVDTIADPVVQTLSPKGANVLYETEKGDLLLTNDGVTIAKQIGSEDEVEDAIIRVIKQSSLHTNAVAGDGTTTSILLSRTLIKEGLKEIDNGMNPMDLKAHLQEVGRLLKKNLKPIGVEKDEEILNIATISANNDSEIGQNVLKIVKTAGTNGMVFLNPSPKEETEIVEDTGFVIQNGIFSPEYTTDRGFSASYDDVHVLVTDKRIYHEQEAEAILRTAVESGIEKLVIVARDFIGKAPNFFSANHSRGTLQLLLVKHNEATEQDNTPLRDLATYLGGKIVSDKDGKLVNNLTAEDFVVAERVYGTPTKCVFVTKNQYSPELTNLVETIEKEKEENPDDEKIEARLAALTNGTVTVNVGGATAIEIQEKVFRYDDAINATRSAMKFGYLPGGGIALLNAYDEMLVDEEAVEVLAALGTLVKNFATSSIRQIAENCGKYPQHIMDNVGGMTGYNAKTDRFCDVVKEGIIDPYKVTEMAIDNSISIAIAILTSQFIIVHGKEKTKEINKGGNTN